MAIKFDSAPSLTAYLSTTLNSLANNACDLGAGIDNTGELDTLMDLELVLASLDLSAQTNPVVNIYLLYAADGGTNFDTGSDAETADANMPPTAKIIATMPLRPYSGAEAKVCNARGIEISPGDFKLMVRNKTGVVFASSGNTLKYRTYSLEST